MRLKFDFLLLVILSLLLCDSQLLAQTGSTYKIQSAGIEFTVPTNWQSLKTNDGDDVVFTEQGAFLIAFISAGDKPDQVIAGLKKGLETKLIGFKSDGLSTRQ